MQTFCVHWCKTSWAVSLLFVRVFVCIFSTSTESKFPFVFFDTKHRLTKKTCFTYTCIKTRKMEDHLGVILSCLWLPMQIRAGYWSGSENPPYDAFATFYNTERLNWSYYWQTCLITENVVDLICFDFKSAFVFAECLKLTLCELHTDPCGVFVVVHFARWFLSICWLIVLHKRKKGGWKWLHVIST